MRNLGPNASRKVGRAAIASLLLLVACATPRGDEQVGNLIGRSVDAARAHYDAGRLAEAGVLLRAVERVAPDDPRVISLYDAIGARVLPLVEAGALGINRRARTPVERRVWERVAYYPLDRLADLLDVVSFEAGVAAGAAIEAYVTRALQAGFGMGWQYGVGLTQPRVLGAQQELEIGLAALNYTQFKMTGRRSGVTGPVVTGVADVTGASTPVLGVYQDYRDYWAVGARVRIGVVGASASLHPVQLVDWVLGFLTIDLANDDNARTLALRLGEADRRILIQLNEVEEIRQYGP